MKLQESTLLDLKASEDGLRGFDFICKTYEDKLKFLYQKLQEKCDGKSFSNHEIALEDFIMSGIDRSRVASMIYSIFTRTMAKGLDSQKQNLMKPISKHIVNALRKD